MNAPAYPTISPAQPTPVLSPAIRELMALECWVVWKKEKRNPTDKAATKIPYDPKNPSRRAASNKPSTWGTYAEAAAAEPNGFDGIGIIIEAPYFFVDLDHCRDRDTGEIHPDAMAIIIALGTYTEISQSLAGLKAIGKATNLPWPTGKNFRPHGKHSHLAKIITWGDSKGGIEIYGAKPRLFCMTGFHLPGTPDDIRDGTEALCELRRQLEPPATAKPIRTTNAVHFDDSAKFKRCRAYVRKMRPAVSGENGHGATFAVAAEAIKFDLSDADAMAILRDYNNGLSEQWSEAELVHKLTDARAKVEAAGERGIRLKEDRNNHHNGNGRIESALQTAAREAREKIAAGQGAAGPSDDDSADDDTDDAEAAIDAPDDDTNAAAALPDADATNDDDNADTGDIIPLGGRDPVTGKRVLSTKRTLPTAKAYVEEFFTHADGHTLHCYAGVNLAWLNNRYSEQEDGTHNNRLLAWLHDALRYHVHKDGTQELVAFDSNPATVEAASKTIKAYVHLPASITPPVWLDGRKNPDPLELLPTPSGNLHVPTGKLLPATPLLFNTNAIDFDYNPNAPDPLEWLKFLDMIWSGDVDSIGCLQEFFGYCLIADTSQQKMLLLVGPKRSGKGTIARILARLVGAANVAGPTVSSLAGPFGLQPLLNKTLAIVSDARFTGDAVGIIVERLLCISGEDTLTVDRKFLSSVTLKLLVRFMFLSNELPRMNDASGALAGRFIVLRLTQSFYGKENVQLTNKLLRELPGILKWAIEGLKRLRQRGRFIQPESVKDAIREMEDLSSPVGAFVRDCCHVEAWHSVPVAEIFEGWQFWSKQQGRDHAGSQQTFGRDLRAAVAGIKTSRPRTEGGRDRLYEGICLTQEAKNAVLEAKMAESERKRGER